MKCPNCPNCKKEMKHFGVTEKGGDKFCCDDCHIHIEEGVVTHGKDKIKEMLRKI